MSRWMFHMGTILLAWSGGLATALGLSEVPANSWQVTTWSVAFVVAVCLILVSLLCYILEGSDDDE